MPHPDFAKAAAHITAGNVLDCLADLVNISSPTGSEIGVAQYLVERMQRSGLDTDLPMVDAGRPNAVGHLRGGGDGVNLLFTGHMDTSYSGDEEHLAGDGFRPKAVVRDGWMFGLGANNMKSGLAAALVAIEAIVKSGIKLVGDISFGAVVGEIEKTAIEEFQGIEYSGYGIGSRHLVTHGVTADFAVLAEPTGMRIAVANMGCIWVRITVDGTVAHSALANRPNVVNAIAVMHELQDDIMQWARDYETAHVYMGEHPNVTMAAIRGGAPWRLSRNPHDCSLYLDIRTVPGQTVDAVKRSLRGVLQRFAKRTGRPEPSVHVYVSDPPTVVDADLPVVRALATAQKEITGESPPAIIRRPGADSVHLTSYGVPCISFGPGGRMHPDSRGTSMHAFGEHVLIGDCVAAAKVYLATALDLCSRKAS
jgi:acetylornithine deacetylase/succinyl-diaminopimelate desuccinylase-like protein